MGTQLCIVPVTHDPRQPVPSHLCQYSAAQRRYRPHPAPHRRRFGGFAPESCWLPMSLRSPRHGASQVWARPGSHPQAVPAPWDQRASDPPRCWDRAQTPLWLERGPCLQRRPQTPRRWRTDQPAAGGVEGLPPRWVRRAAAAVGADGSRMLQTLPKPRARHAAGAGRHGPQSHLAACPRQQQQPQPWGRHWG
jgi:hypothetical protein